MNTYKITAVVNDTGREITDRVTEANENAAKKDFRVIYRHAGQFTITDVELVKDNVSASKQQERDAIEKIRAILETLGPNSYTATALEGCLEIADQNIEYDFADSMKGRAESAGKKVKELTSEIERLQGMRKHIEGKLAAAEQAQEANFKEAQKAYSEARELKAQLEAAQTKVANAEASILEATTEAQKTIDRQADEILRLKAKLYDLITK